MIPKDIIVKDLLNKIKGAFAEDGVMADKAFRAYEMGEEYAQTKKFDNSRFYHNYKYRLDDGSTISSSSFFNQFTNRSQTAAFMKVEEVLKEFFDDSDQTLFRLVREKRAGINGVYKAVMTPDEPQQLSFVDYVLVVACFCAGVINK